ncbi:MAG: hypothetical protein ACEQSL_09585 [Sediminibacterium sp.]
MSALNHHDFTSDQPIEIIVKNFVGIDLHMETLESSLLLLQQSYAYSRSTLSPTTGQFGIIKLRTKYEYLCKGVIVFFQGCE